MPKVKKTNLKTGQNAKMSSAELKKALASCSDIGTDRSEGCIIILKKTPTKDGSTVTGTVYINEMSKHQVMSSITNGLEIDPAEMLLSAMFGKN